MSIQIVEIASDQGVSIVEIRQGPAGAGSSPEWGGIGGTLSDQTDLQSALDLKAPLASPTFTGTVTADHIHGNLAGSVYMHVRAGEALSKGDPVFVSGSHGTGSAMIPIVMRADASNLEKMPAIAIMDAAVANNANGHAVINGVISDLNTAAYSINATLYVANGGGMTDTKPTNAQPVARVERSDANNGGIVVKVNGLYSDINPANIGAQPAGSYAPASGIAPSAIAGTAVVTSDARLTNERTPTDNSATNAKLADMAAGTIKGRAIGAGTGDPQDLTPDQILAIAPPTAASIAAAMETATGTQERSIRDSLGVRFFSVKDFGAVGNGTTDDTSAVQSALAALEASTTTHRLVFPPGTYRLATRTAHAVSGTGSGNYMLLLGGTSGLDGRDIEIVGEPGAVLRNETSPTRASLLFCWAKFRSFKVHGLRFEKDDTPLAATAGEPNGCDAISIVQHDFRTIDLVEIYDNTFYNCHRAVSTYIPGGYGNAVRGLLRTFRMTNNEVLNPWGSNTVNGASSVGGGQQVLLNGWTRSGIFQGNAFVGCGDAVDLAKNPGAIPKDGSYFGNSEKLVFTGNTMRNFGVEGVFQGSGASQRGIFSNFTVPAIGSNVTTTRAASPNLCSFTAGEIVYAYASQFSREMEVVSYNSTTGALVLKNIASANSTAAIGYTFSEPIIYGKSDEPSTATITGNVYYGGQTVGIAANSHGGAIYSQVRATISGNAITNTGNGVTVYPNVSMPGALQADGTVVSGNTYRGLPLTITNALAAILVAQPNALVEGNTLIYETNQRRHGIQIGANNNTIRNNTALVLTPVNNGYSSAERSVGVTESPGFTGNLYVGNRTRGFDVGIGPRNVPAQLAMNIVSHFSEGDFIGIDTTSGILPERVGLREELETIGQMRNVRPISFASAFGGSAVAWSNGFKIVAGVELNTNQVVKFDNPIAGGTGNNTSGSIPFVFALNGRQGASSANSEFCFAVGVNSASMPAFAANKLTGRGCGFRISNGQIFLFSHDGTTYSETAGVTFATSISLRWRPVLLSWDGVSTLKLISTSGAEASTRTARATTVLATQTIAGLAGGNLANFGEVVAWSSTGGTTPTNQQGEWNEIKLLGGQAF